MNTFSFLFIYLNDIWTDLLDSLASPFVEIQGDNTSEKVDELSKSYLLRVTRVAQGN